MYVTPIRLLHVRVTSVASQALWTDSSNPSDAFINYPYRWTVTFSVISQAHSDPSTRVPYYYAGLDIAVGDWFSNAVGGAAWQIVSITSANDTTVVVVVEDIDLFNTVSDPSGSASGAPANLIDGFIFQVGDDGLPILAPLVPLVITPQWQTDVISRFLFRNMTEKYYKVHQVSHGFTTGQLIKLTSAGTYALASAITDTVIGIVRDSAIPSADYFTYRPIGQVINNISPTLPGNPGDLIYLNPSVPGGYTNVAPASALQQPIYIRLETSSKGILLSRGSVLVGPQSPTTGVVYTLQYLNGVMSWVTTTGAVMGVSPSSLVFPNTPVGQSSTLSLTISNTGNAPLVISSITPSGDFTDNP